MSITQLRLTLLWVTSLTTAVQAGTMVEIVLDGQTHTGTVVSHNKIDGWFLERDGRLRLIELASVTDYKPLGSYRPYSSIELRERLAREFGRGYSVTSSGHYLVVSGPGVDPRFGPLFEELYRQFVVAFAARGFQIKEPSTPLIAIVFPNEQKFAEYCESEGITPLPGLRGYYLPMSNRVALYDSVASGQGTARSLDQTVLHEAVHQVAFNTGIHSRTGTNPKWVVEGLATTLEVDTARQPNRIAKAAARINEGRWQWMLDSKGRRGKDSLPELIREDRLFEQATLDAYSQAWAVTFFLMETRSAEYTRYLKLLAERDAQRPYSADERLADFQRIFGRDLSSLEAQMNRFFDQLALDRSSEE